MTTHYAIQYRWPGNEWSVFHHSAEQLTLESAMDEMASMEEQERRDFPLDTIRMEYRILKITYEVYDINER